jgi:hypothetical protein
MAHQQELLMHRLAFLAAFALVLGATQALADCNDIGCVRPINGLERLAEDAKRTFSLPPATKPITALGLCGIAKCATEPARTQLPEKCGSAGCAMPEPKRLAAAAAANEGSAVRASTLVTDAFATVAAQSVHLSPALRWAEWAHRWGYGGLYKSASVE